MKLNQEKWLYIIRHGETDYNKNHIVQGGGVDSVLNTTGHAQANAFYQNYRDYNFDLIICSTLKRSYQTIQPFLSHETPLERYAEINEINWGIHEGQKSLPWLVQSYQQVVKNWNSGNYDAAVDKGESAAALADRLRIFLNIVKRKEEKRMLICSHGRTLRCLMCLINNEPIANMEQYGHSNTGLYLIKLDGDQFITELHNDTAHLHNKLIL